MLSNIFITRDDYDDAKNFLIQYLRDSGFEGSLDDGTALHDLLIKAFSLFYILYKRESQKASAYLSLDHAKALRHVLGEDYDTAVDSILSNWFVKRKDGTQARGYIRFWFSKPISFLHFKDDNLIANIGTVKIAPTYEQVFTENDFQVYVNTVNNIAEYYVDVQCKSVENHPYTIPARSKVTTSVNSTSFLRATVEVDFSAGSSKEDSSEFISRTSQAITTRELITERAINTVLMDQVGNIYSIYCAGFGAKEQIRDIVEFETVKVHVGNKCDIYISGNLIKAYFFALVDFEGKIHFSTKETMHPVSFIDSIRPVRDNDLLDSTPFNYDKISEVAANSMSEETVVHLPSVEGGSLVRVDYYTIPAVREAHEFLYNPDNRVVSYDPMAKSKFLVKINFNITAYVENLTDEPKFKNSLITATKFYLQSLAKGHDSFKRSEYTAILHRSLNNLINVQVPLGVTYSFIDPATGTRKTGEVPNDFLLKNLSQPLSASKQVTDNTIMLFTTDASFNVTLIAK